MKKILSIFILIAGVFSLQAQTSQKDADFLKKSAEGGLMEVKFGQLAATNGSSAEVKQLGQMMVDEHTKANAELKDLAARKNVVIPSALSAKHQKAYDKAAQKHGKAFDKSYAHCMVKDHKKDIAEFKEEAEKGSDSDVKSWASKTTPTLEHHLEMSKTTCKAVKSEK